MHLHFERNSNAKCDCTILSLTWMGKVPDELPEDEGWKLNRTNYYQEGWLATANVRGIVGVTFTTSHCKRGSSAANAPDAPPLRTNYNLRGHRSEVMLVKWNEPYQKLASCDSSGIIFVWIKYEGRWSIELINDRNTPVTHFSWSHDGRMALICYQDGFVLVGSVAGQRYWSSMLNLNSTITCGIWTPDDQQVYLGTAAGQMVVMDVHGAMVSQVQLGGDAGGDAAAITGMAWSCEKFKMEEGDDQPSDLAHPHNAHAEERSFVLAVSMRDGLILLMKSFDDVSPVAVRTGLAGPLCMEWSNSRELLAVAGSTHPTPSAPASPPQPSDPGPPQQQEFLNMLKFYSDAGVLLYSVVIPYTQSSVSALTWGHNDKRLFVATGCQLHIAWVSRRIASLQLLCRLRVHRQLRLAGGAGCEAEEQHRQLGELPLPPRIKALIANLFAQTIRCCVPEASALRQFVSRPPANGARLHCTMIRHDDECNLSAGTCYTLYLEYLGGLVPLLKGKRTSKIRPEFVIFDPQVVPDAAAPSASADHNAHNAPANNGESSCLDATCSTCEAHRLQQQQNGGGGVSSSSVLGGSDTSDTEREDGCGSPRAQRRRRRRRRHKAQGGGGGGGGGGGSGGSNGDKQGDKEQEQDDLAYVDTLPEHVRLVEVTSNIWGTKFKIHGLASSVPANLGQVTYKTSLLHLQPRQMTLQMTELRDDVPAGPDPNFNPNLFSEDEEEPPPQGQAATAMASPPMAAAPTAAMPARAGHDAMPIAPMTPRPIHAHAHAHAHHVHAHAHAHAHAPPGTSAAAAQGRCGQMRAKVQMHGDASASASSAGTGLSLAKAEACDDEYPYVDLTEVAPLCESLRTASPPPPPPPAQPHPPLNLNLAGDDLLKPQVLVKSAAATPDNLLASLKSSHHKRGATKSSPSGNQIGIAGAKWCVNKQQDEQLLFIDDDPSDPPVCLADSMVRSCSVGYLDLVDAQLVPCEVALMMLRKDTPKRLVLVNQKKQKKHKSKAQHGHESADKSSANCSSSQPPKLKHCGKSKSLDSTDIFTAREHSSAKNLPSDSSSSKPHAVNMKCIDENFKNPTQSPNAVQNKAKGGSASETASSQDAVDKVVLNPKLADADVLLEKLAKESNAGKKKGSRLAAKDEATASGSGGGSGGGSSTTAQVMASLASLVALDSLTCRARHLEDTHSLPPPSPVASPRLPRSSPASPAPSKKAGKRNQSSSPIRKHLLNSPLLNRRQRKSKNTESSDDEVIHSGDEVFNGKNYRDLESFQKAQLRQKLKRGKFKDAPECISIPQTPRRREFVMHNKAPMWNENSQVYQLDFGGRVTQESAKNFQIEFRGKQVMQFGRIDGNAYTLDFQYPFSALQAFAVALANVTQRLK